MLCYPSAIQIMRASGVWYGTTVKVRPLVVEPDGTYIVPRSVVDEYDGEVTLTLLRSTTLTRCGLTGHEWREGEEGGVGERS